MLIFTCFLGDQRFYSLSLSLSPSLAFKIIRGEGGIESCCFWGDAARVDGSRRSQVSSSLSLSLSVVLNYYFRFTDMTRKTVVFPTNTFVSEVLLCVIAEKVGKVRKYILLRALYFVSDWFSVSLITSRQPQEGEADQNIFEMVLSPVPLFCSSL